MIVKQVKNDFYILNQKMNKNDYERYKKQTKIMKFEPL